jgi:uncharacterized protein YecE (DUF72 family)
MGRSRHPLTVLSEWFDTVEINASFYRPSTAKQAAGWLRQVADRPDFRFTGKLWQRFTHERGEWPGDDVLRDAVEAFQPLHDAGRFGALVIQFPWSFRRTPANRQWLGRLIDGLPGWPLCVELRHASWDLEEVYEGFRARGVAFCSIDQPLFHDSLAPGERVTAPLGYVRLHGRNRDAWFQEGAGRDQRYDYLYTPAEVTEWTNRIGRIRAQAETVYVLTGRHVRIPDHLLTRFPRLDESLK